VKATGVFLKKNRAHGIEEEFRIPQKSSKLKAFSGIQEPSEMAGEPGAKITTEPARGVCVHFKLTNWFVHKHCQKKKN